MFRRAVERKRLDDLLRGPLCRRMSRDIEMDDASTMMGEHDEDEQNLEPDGLYREEVDGNELGYMIGRNVLHVWDGGLEGRTMYLATDAWEILMPSFKSSP